MSSFVKAANILELITYKKNYATVKSFIIGEQN